MGLLGVQKKCRSPFSEMVPILLYPFLEKKSNEITTSFSVLFTSSSGQSWLLGRCEKNYLGIRADYRVPLDLQGARPAPILAEPYQTSHP